MAVVHIKISGPFTSEDIAAFVSLVRTIDARSPTEIFKITVLDPELGLDASEAMLRRMLPSLPDRATTFARAAYRDDAYPERNCDHCGMSYQGPAVYCSLECALADGRLDRAWSEIRS